MDQSMSSLTRCNYCVLEGIKRRNPGKLVETRPDDGWLRVYVDGEPQDVLLLELTGRCVC
jgi:hypothetical protein